MLGDDVVDIRDADSVPESFRPRFDSRVFSEEERRAIAHDRDPLARRWAHWAGKEAAYKLARQIDPSFIFSPRRLEIEFESMSGEASRRTERRGFVRFMGHATNGAIPNDSGDASRRFDTEDGTSRALPARAEVRSFESEDYVHVVALPVGADWGAVDHAAEPLEATDRDPDDAVRKLAIREIARSLGVTRSRLSVGFSDARCGGWAEGAPRSVLGRSLSVRATPRRSNPLIELDGVATSLVLSLAHHGRFISFAMTPSLEPPVVGDLPSRMAVFSNQGATRL